MNKALLQFFTTPKAEYKVSEIAAMDKDGCGLTPRQMKENLLDLAKLRGFPPPLPSGRYSREAVVRYFIKGSGKPITLLMQQLLSAENDDVAIPARLIRVWLSWSLRHQWNLPEHNLRPSIVKCEGDEEGAPPLFVCVHCLAKSDTPDGLTLYRCGTTG